MNSFLKVHADILGPGFSCWRLILYRYRHFLPIYSNILYAGMDGATTLERVVSGYRMARPAGRNLDCPPKMYEVMLKCWDANPLNRPTFTFLLNFFDDYATESEEHYRPPEDE